VDNEGPAGDFNSIAFDGTTAAISYFDGAGGALRVARSTSLGRTWGLAEVPDGGGVGKYVSAALISGLPAVSYYDEFNGDLKFAWYSPGPSTGWHLATVDSTGDVGLFTSLAVLSNNIPAISYYDAGNGNLKFVRTLAPPFNNLWGTPLTLDSAGDVGRFSSLALVNGNPAIAYFDASNGRLKYVRALDAGGTSWGAAIVVDTGSSYGSANVGQFASLAVINGRPAIAYYDANLKHLMFVHASDANGVAWGTPLTVDPVADRGQNATLKIVNGRPAIFYYDATATSPLYIHAADADGLTWGSPGILDGGTQVGRYGTLNDVNGNPSVTYSDTANGLLKNVYPIKPFQINWFAIEP